MVDQVRGPVYDEVRVGVRVLELVAELSPENVLEAPVVDKVGELLDVEAAPAEMDVDSENWTAEELVVIVEFDGVMIADVETAISDDIELVDIGGAVYTVATSVGRVAPAPPVTGRLPVTVESRSQVPAT